MSTGKKWLVRFFLLVFIALVTMGLWLPPIITHAVEKDYHFPEVDIDATVLPNGDMMLEETRTFDFQNGPFRKSKVLVSSRTMSPFGSTVASISTSGKW